MVAAGLCEWGRTLMIIHGIVSYVSPFMADTLMGISRVFEFMIEIYPPTP